MTKRQKQDTLKTKEINVQEVNGENIDSRTLQSSEVGLNKKPYQTPTLTHEGKWDTVTMQFGGSFMAE